MRAPTAAPASRSRRYRAVGGDRGAATVETVLVMPLVMAAILAIAQASIWLYADHAARAVATSALDATRVRGGSVQAGRARAHRLIGQLGHGSLTDPHINLHRGSTTATITVTAQAPAILPWTHLSVRVHQQAPVERYTTPGGPP